MLKIEKALHPFIPPARLSTGVVWQIIHYTLTDDGRKVRERSTFDLNRISDYAKRYDRAEKILAEVFGIFDDPSIKKYKDSMAILAAKALKSAKGPGAIKPTLISIEDALSVALKIKMQSDRRLTRNTYSSMHNIFMDWVRSQGWEKWLVSDFTKTHAIQYMDYIWMARKNRKGQRISAVTYNNVITNTRAVWTEAVKRYNLPVNPFSNIEGKKATEKLRTSISKSDSDIIIKHIYTHKKKLFLAILLLAHGGVRIEEMLRMRYRNFDLRRGLIVLSGDQTKNHENAFITLPKDVITMLFELGVDREPVNALVFPSIKEPGCDKPVGRNTLTNQFRSVLGKLIKKALINSADGYTLYSWKDTGAKLLLESGVDIITLQHHLRHKDLSTTQRYLVKRGVVNRDIRSFNDLIFNYDKKEQP